MRTTVAAIIPTHDRASWVLRAVRSVLAQTRPPEQVIVVDDGSSDGTAELLARETPEVVVVRQARRGVSAARNRGIAAASTPWLAFLDSDDEWLPEKLERQLDALAENPDHVLCHTEEVWIRRGNQVLPRRIHKKRGGWIFEECLERCAISPSAAIVHRRVFDAIGTFDESLPACEDYDLWLRMCARYPVLLVDEPLVRKYGGHADQLSRAFVGVDRYRIRALEKLLADPQVSAAARNSARRTLQERIRIYADGARKRGRLAEAAQYEARLGEPARVEA